MKRILSASLLAFFLPALSFAQADLQPAAVVKLTKTEAITVKQLKAEIAKIEAQSNRSLPAADRRRVLDLLVDAKLVMQAAERDKLGITDNELSKQLDPQISQLRAAMKARLGREPNAKEVDDAIRAETGYNLADFREQMRQQLTYQKYLTTKKRAAFEAIKPPTEAEIASTYDLYKSRFVRPDTVRLSVIFIPRGDGAEGYRKSKELADRLAAEIGGNAAKFDEVALRSKLPNAEFEADSGTYLEKSAEAIRVVGPEFMNAVFALKLGEVSRVLENQRSFQLVKATEIYAQKILELGDPYKLGARGTVRDYIGQMLFQQTQQKVIEEATAELLKELKTANSFQVFDKNLNW